MNIVPKGNCARAKKVGLSGQNQGLPLHFAPRNTIHHEKFHHEFGWEFPNLSWPHEGTSEFGSETATLEFWQKGGSFAAALHGASRLFMLSSLAKG